jgi:hypothetical protein
MGGDEWHRWREAHPFGGDLSVRFPGGRPALALPQVPEVPDPAVDVAEVELGEEEDADDAPSAAGAQLVGSAALSRSAISKLKVSELKEKLTELQLDASGRKAELKQRLLDHLFPSDTAGVDEDEGDDEAFDVHKIIDTRLVNGALEYKVQWQGPEYRDADGNLEATWEPYANIRDCDFKLAEYYSSDPEPGCKYRHRRGICKCSRPLIASGQDESIYKQYQMSKKQVSGSRRAPREPSSSHAYALRLRSAPHSASRAVGHRQRPEHAQEDRRRRPDGLGLRVRGARLRLSDDERGARRPQRVP